MADLHFGLLNTKKYKNTREKREEKIQFDDGVK